MVDVPGGGNKGIHAEVDGHQIRIHVPITVHRAQNPGASASHHSCGAVQVVDPAHQRLLGRRRDDRRPEDADGDSCRVAAHHILGQRFCVGVRVGPVADQSANMVEQVFQSEIIRKMHEKKQVDWRNESLELACARITGLLSGATSQPHNLTIGDHIIPISHHPLGFLQNQVRNVRKMGDLRCEDSNDNY